MSRKNTTGRVPQRCRREAQREVRRGIHMPFPKAFGIRRMLNPEVSRTILLGLHELQAQNDIPKNVELRSSLHATLLPKRVFGQQVLKGLVSGYNLRSMSTEFKRKTEGSDEDPVSAEMSGVSVYKGRVINVKLISTEMDKERLDIAETLEALGLRGLRRVKEETVLHMSLGQSKSGLTQTEQRHVEHIVTEKIDATYGMENLLPFEEWHTYPDLSYWQQ